MHPLGDSNIQGKVAFSAFATEAVSHSANAISTGRDLVRGMALGSNYSAGYKLEWMLAVEYRF